MKSAEDKVANASRDGQWGGMSPPQPIMRSRGSAISFRIRRKRFFVTFRLSQNASAEEKIQCINSTR